MAKPFDAGSARSARRARGWAVFAVFAATVACYVWVHRAFAASAVRLFR